LRRVDGLLGEGECPLRVERLLWDGWSRLVGSGDVLETGTRSRSVTLEAREQLLDYIANPATRSSLHAYVRRRGLEDSAEDLVQTVLCDALAVEAVPERDSELPRWLTGIARNKVVDEHRRRARWKRADLPEDLEAPRSSDARDLLQRIAREVVEPEERRALDWLVREHEGDSLYLIALDQALEPSTLRQRICRLRRALRARYLAPLVVVLGLGSAWAVHDAGAERPAVSMSEASSPYSGTWRVVTTSPAKYARLGLSVRIDGGVVRVIGPTAALSRDLVIESVVKNQVTLRSGKSVWVARFEQLAPDHLRLSSSRGSVELQR
jgi:DNA-directed RNA polymerase specialized sigma24 family protein